MQKHAKIGQKTSSFECFCTAAAGHYPKISTAETQHSSKTEGTFLIRTVMAGPDLRFCRSIAVAKNADLRALFYTRIKADFCPR
jgi:hypothetical protein